MNIRILFLIVSVFASIIGHAQVTTDPTLPIHNQKVKLIYDATQGTAGLKDFTGDVYAHIGVLTSNSSGNSDWKYVKTNWGQNSDATKMTRTAANTYELELTPNIRSYFNVPTNEKITHIALVFRSADSSKEGKATGNKDIFVKVFEEGLDITITAPSHPHIVQTGSDVTISATTTVAANIELFKNNTSVATADNQTSISYTETFNEAGDFWFKVIATSGSNTVRDSVFVNVAAPVQNIPVPTGMVDGINYYTDDATKATLVIYAPNKQRINVLGDFNNWLPSNANLMHKDGDRFWLTIENLVDGKEYVFQYLIDGTIKIGDPYADKVSDPYDDRYISDSVYPSLIEYPTGKAEGRATVLQTNQSTYNWQNNNFTAPVKEKLVIYEMLFRDFTEEGTVKAAEARLDYLEELGINAIHLMPFNEFEGNISWGYNPNFYFAPDKAYGTKDDYKHFIDECHKRGIAVIQDIVLNHAFNSCPLVRMYWDSANNRPAADNPWFNQQSNFTNPALHWGSDFNHESAATQQFTDRVLKYWIEEYKIDGYRFDFTKGFGNNPKTGNDEWGSRYDADRVRLLKRMAEKIWSYKANAYLIFEHLADNSEEKELANSGIMLWGNMNHNYNEATMGYNENNKSNLEWTSWKKRGWDEPNLIAYMESHDEERIMYKNLQYGKVEGSYNIKTLNTALARNKLATVFFFSFTGPKLIWQFGELGYDISIDENGRTGEKPVHWDYLNNENRKWLHNKYEAMIGLRKQFDVFTSGTETLNVNGEVKQITLANDDLNVVTVGNFATSSKTGTISFPKTGTWYDFFSGNSINVSAANYTMQLAPGEYRLYTDKQIENYKQKFTTTPEQEKNNGLTIYPNPVRSTLNINTTENISRVDVYNAMGAQVLTSTRKQLDVNSLSSGIYILKIETSNGKILSQRFVKR
jgi:1,4-alpha-glucan branching enzyme